MYQAKKRLLLLTLLALLALTIGACASSSTPAATDSGESASDAAAPAADSGEAATDEGGEKSIIIGFSQEPELLNPIIYTQTVADEVAEFLVEDLLAATDEGEYVAVLAEEVPSVENGLITDDGLTVTYNLREGMLWQDGEPLTCDDFLFTWELAMNPAETGAVNTTDLSAISSLECPDDNTIVTKYDEFYAPFLTTFSSNILLPRHATGDPTNMSNWAYNREGFVGNGPFKLQEWVSGDQIIMVKNENYHGYPDSPKVDRIIARIIPSREVGKALITSGEIDILWDLSEADVPEFEENPDVDVYSRPGLGTERLVINLADPALDATDDPLNNPHPLLGDLRVRQAIELGIDKQFIVDELLFGATTVGTSELSLGWAKCDIAPSAYDPDAAIALLEEAGFTDEDGDGVRECHDCEYAEEGAPLSLKYQTTSGNQLREESQQLVLEMMADIGIEFYIENVPSAELFGSWDSGAFRKHGNFDILMYTTSDVIDPQSQMDGYFSANQIPVEANGGSGFNYSRWINEEATAAIDAAGKSADQAGRAANYQIACEQITAELPHIYLYDRAEIGLARSNITGFGVNVFENSITWGNANWDKE
ncbi:MAG: peptide ABC transporter substrate-binding protein [Caldilineaceae bacterium]|nr:peptide ABC transporter substrate-binding protein [Caldilineaceae bacterium]